LADRDARSATSAPPPRVHHAVFAVGSQSFEPATRYLERLGFNLIEHILDDVGLRVRIDWAGGMEIVTPIEGHVAESGSVGEFLSRFGDGLFTVVVRVPDAERASADAQAAGSLERYRQQRGGPGFTLTEIQMEPRFGLPVTFLEADID
jgi:4-hydroxyphenylpyruvate dioxygenase-like putative hemolysin